MSGEMLQLLLVSLTIKATLSAMETYEVDYNSNVTFSCNFTLHNITYLGLQVPFRKYWVLPNATVLQDTFLGDDKFSVKNSPYDLKLVIRNVDDPDFGVYFCIILWNNVDYKMNAISVGLNEQGPYYKSKLEEFQRNLIIGCASAGGAALLIIIACIACRCRKKKSSEDDSIPTRNVSIYSVDHNMKKYCYEDNYGTDLEDEIEGKRHSRRADEEYATVSKASVRAPAQDHMTVQSAHL